MDRGDVWSNLAARATGDAARDKTVVNRIMLRFRPIAPKPVAGGSASGATVPENTSNVLLSGKRAKRKYVRVRRNSGCGRKDNNNNRSSERSGMTDDSDNAVVTLQLMPEKSEPSGGWIAGRSWCKNADLDVTVEKVEISGNPEPTRPWTTTGTTNGARMAVETWVTVESVGYTCTNLGGLGSTDAEKVKNLESDTCPGFVSDGTGKVGWVNEAYRRMVRGNEAGGSPEEVVVRLKVKDNVIYSYEAFTCGVRLQYTWQKEKWTKMVPCDVWKLDCGGFAWRLDIQAALSLGL
ncbi:uncharacterized protein LOC129306016 [Prosopis cineraria]|uniref:uncharacterized protein LOC129306016 n=1 Tax=Prosopis cineraria TaxID=364024 RepID=UPI00240EA7A1|nr:uncharacterized protein LOC129306016 [Prosopis cineraria]XP_054802295.1 uncharacterized protein LOC129306016 [Prosopis cineraria]XP_054802304.1 uncharacterized protein LOC129306016 [Prosopis cineraria]XP_054802312.1 uncharacterized protein LOC129306016 [Prosopis cineraria]XP_054802320.1 uncharacterized protein LOC129306016 [Prosopis cineraria]